MTPGETVNLVVGVCVGGVTLYVALQIQKFRSEVLSWRMNDRDWVEAHFQRKNNG